jgi:hypothetical protein
MPDMRLSPMKTSRPHAVLMLPLALLLSAASTAAG